MSILSLWFYILAFVHRNTMYRVPCTAATIRFVGWKIGSTTLLAKSCSCILSFWRGFNSLIRTIRIKLSSSSFQKSGLSPILSSKVRWWSTTLGSLNTLKKSGQDLEQRRNCSRVLAAFCRMQSTFCECDLSPSLCKFVFKLSRKHWKHVGGKFCWTCHI